MQPTPGRQNMHERVLVTGCAGFIGYHVCQRLLTEQFAVVGIDNLSDYYDVTLKTERLQRLEPFSRFQFIRADLADRGQVARVFAEHHFDIVLHLAAQPGVRYSMERPHAYIDSNVVAFMNVLEAVKEQGVRHFLFASSSSVYGADSPVPFSVHTPVEHPISLYAATKKSNELFAYVYSHLFGIPATGLRFFTVYGPWGRPDMAYFKFAQKIMLGETIDIYNHGNMQRDFTYVDDVVEAIRRIISQPPDKHEPPFRLFNVGKGSPDSLLAMVEILEQRLGKQAEKRFLPPQPGDPLVTYADMSELNAVTGFAPQISLEDGLTRFTEWFRQEFWPSRFR